MLIHQTQTKRSRDQKSLQPSNADCNKSINFWILALLFFANETLLVWGDKDVHS